jgi:hypothetical protein
MPPTELLVFREANGRIPLEEWLDALPAKARAKCLNYMRLLAISGHELRRPAADFLRDGIYELRVSYGTVQYRILYFFHGRTSWFFRTASPRGRKFPMLKSSAPSRVNGL